MFNFNQISTLLGDILVFLTGQDEIETISDELDEYSRRQVAPELELIVVPCYGTLPFEQQQKIFERTPKGFRKVFKLMTKTTM